MTAHSNASVPLPKHPDVLVIVQARAGSKRLPGKIFMPVAGEPMLSFLLERLRRDLPWPVLVATSDRAGDDKTEELAHSAGFPVVRGDEDDVFSRFRKATELTEAHHVVRLTGDNPLMDAPLVRACVQAHLESDADFTSTREVGPDGEITRYVPKGQSVDVIKSAALLGIDGKDLSGFEREHVIPVFFRPAHGFKLNILKNLTTTAPAVSVDTREDYERLTRLFGA